MAYLLFCYWLYAKTDLNDKNEIENKKIYKFLPTIGIVIYLFGLFCKDNKIKE